MGNQAKYYGTEGVRQQHATARALETPADGGSSHKGLQLSRLDGSYPWTLKVEHSLGRAPDFVYITPAAPNPGLVYVLSSSAYYVTFTGSDAFTFDAKLE